MSSLAQVRYTPEQYLAREREAQYKSEYINGYIFAMVGASREHNLITSNVNRELNLQLRGRPCETYASDMRVNLSLTGMYAYPDVVVVCGEPHFDDAHRDNLLNPTVIVEVLSDSTEAYDRGEKFAHCRRLASISDYVLIAQDKVCVEHYVRQGEQWVFSEFSDFNGTVPLASIGCHLMLRDIYDKVPFPPDDEAGASNRTAVA